MDKKRSDKVELTLMHKHTPVADLLVLSKVGWVCDVVNILNISHAPIGTIVGNNLDIEELSSWIKGRSIPESRENVDKMLKELKLINTPALALLSLGLSLSDQYWLKPTGVDLQWESVNFFQNDFSDDVGEILFGTKDSRELSIDISSPNNTSDGVLRKKWLIQGGKRVLMKGGNDFISQEPYNEVIATKIMQQLGISHVEYTLGYFKKKPYCFCDNFIDEDTELVNAWRVHNVLGMIPTDNKYQHFLKCCEKLGIKNAQHDLEKMMVLDYIIANRDRHYGNFGFVRNANSLEWVSFAPIYDSGTSLWGREDDEITDGIGATFTFLQSQQIKFLTDLSWYNPIPERWLKDTVIEILSDNKRLEEQRIVEIAEGITRNAKFITNLKKELHPK